MQEALTCTIISCSARTHARELTIPQLQAAGLNPEVFLSDCNPPGPEGNRSAMTMAVTWAATRESDLLYCEDDIDLAPDFNFFLQHARKQNDFDAAWFYINDNPNLPGRQQSNYGQELWESIKRKEPQERRFVRPVKHDQLYGSQCIYVKSVFVKRIASLVHTIPRNDAGGPSGDTLIRKILDESNARIRIALPHPVQHRHDTTLYELRVGGRVNAARIKRSMSYELPRLGTTVII